MEQKQLLISGFADEIDPSLDRQLEALQKVGIHYIEMRGVDGKSLVRCTDGELAVIRRKLDATGIQLSAVGSPLGKIGIEDNFAPHWELFQRTVEIAQKLDAPFIRIFSFYPPEGQETDACQGPVLERLARMVEYAKIQNTVLLHENGKGIFGDTADRCKLLLDTLGCENFKAVFDFANFVQCGEDTWRAYTLLRSHVAYVHIKDALYSDGSVVPPGSGDGLLENILGALIRGGYAGFLSLEPHLSDFTGFGALEKGRHQEWRALSGEAAFRLAHDALMEILNRL